ncbi:hypothetical protein SELMODRAFT_93581 [Selaginella moellendorffii]|uniref:Kinesin motor domain-containing protein n=1 Tax=Selaginella moellendorffii TaxID=88036 RepID=D8RH59_SELML|nr:hypothetical protein SELMODRAFT_93581 [Selaginella moellendorffii]
MEEGLSDIHMASRRAEEAAHRRFLAARWLHEMLGGLGISNEPSEEELKFSLRNGMVLCNLLNKIHPGIIPKIVESPPPSSPPDAALSAYQYFENVRNFLVAVEDLRLPSFEASDLAEGSLSSGTLSKVVDCILALKAYHDQREGKGFSPWKYGVHKLSGTKSPVKGLEDMYEPAITPKSSHTRKRWAIPGADVPEATDISGQPVQSLPSLVKSIISDKQPDEVPVLVEYMIKKVTDEFERRLRLQGEQNLKHTSGLIRTGTLEMQKCWQDQLIRLENELTGLTEAAQAYHDVLAENRKLYNEVQDLKGNIRVYCRVRPFLVGQKDQGTCVDFVGQNGEIMVANSTKGKDSYKMFNFNKVYGPQAPQDEVFLDAQPLIRSVLDGFNVCIFAYGQTGSGKTYTMTGPSSTAKQDWGVNYRALNDLFQLCQSRRDAFAYEVGVQMIEIYNEQVRDLLAADGVSKRLGIRSSSSLNGVHVPDAVMIPVANSSDVLEIMAVGQRNRAVGATALNERSSRSHSVLTVHVQGTDLAKGCILRGCLHLVDLAGSERVEKSEATGDRLKEAQHINKSLSALGDVIAALAQKQTHIPYRNSKLTQLLQHSLGGQAKALMFVHINPDNDSYGETISTLKFAERVSSVELGAARSNREASGIREYKEQIMSLKEILAKKDAEIERLQASRVLRSSMEVEKQKLRVSQSTRSIDARSRRSVELRSMEVIEAGSGCHP